jgi:hypothetical protein
MSKPWDEFEAVVLRWVLDHGDKGTGELPHDSAEPFGAIPELSEAEVAQALKRLHQYGLVAGEESATFSFERWRELRPTADGLRVLGEWPPAEAAAVNVALARILRAFADTAAVLPEEKTAARRAAGTLASLAGDVVMDVAQGEMRQLGGGA